MNPLIAAASVIAAGLAVGLGSGYDRFDRKEGIVCIFRWGFPGIKRRVGRKQA